MKVNIIKKTKLINYLLIKTFFFKFNKNIIFIKLINFKIKNKILKLIIKYLIYLTIKIYLIFNIYKTILNLKILFFYINNHLFNFLDINNYFYLGLNYLNFIYNLLLQIFNFNLNYNNLNWFLYIINIIIIIILIYFNIYIYIKLYFINKINIFKNFKLIYEYNLIKIIKLKNLISQIFKLFYLLNAIFF